MQFEGIIEVVKGIPSKFTDRAGNAKMMYSMVVNGTSYGTKNTKPPAEGTYVKFEAEQVGQYWNADPASIKPTQAPVKPSTVNAGSKSAAPFVDVRQDSIIYQSSRKDALEFVKLMQAADVVDFGKAKNAQKIEILEVYVDHYTTRFFNDAKNLSPPEHDSPVNAEIPQEAAVLQKPIRKPKPVAQPAEQDDEPFEDDIPFG